jgi:hypothetical protein
MRPSGRATGQNRIGTTGHGSRHSSPVRKKYVFIQNY